MSPRLLLRSAASRSKGTANLCKRAFLTSWRWSSTTSSTGVPSAPYDILFCGTDSFASCVLSSLVANRSLCSSLHVLTPPDVEQSWGASRMKVSPVKQLALQHALPHQDVPAAGLDNYEPPQHLCTNPKAILLTCSFGHLIPDRLLDSFPDPWQRINIHPSLLPNLRGAAPIQWALARRLHTSGVSIQTLEKGRFDTGTIVNQQAFRFPPDPLHGQVESHTFLHVQRVMAHRAADLLVLTLSNLPHCWQNRWIQDEAQRTYAPKLKSKHSAIQWSTWAAPDIVARERAFAYLYPLTTTLLPPPSWSSNANFRSVGITLFDTCTMAYDRLRHLDPTLSSVLQQPSIPEGSATYSLPSDALIVKTTSDTHVLAVAQLKVAGKRRKTALEWWRAYRDRADAKSGLLRFQ